ncbi:Precursor of CEP3 [Linum grandiflorum]
MAKLASSTFLLLLILILSQQPHSIGAARHLKDYQNTLANTKAQHFVNGAVSESLDVPASPSTDEPLAPPSPAGRGVDGFRPTTPGHSPGVGHSTHN